MATHGSCLCGGVRFEVLALAGPFEICHCSRCRKLSGSIGLPGIYIRADEFRLVAGADLIASWDAPILHRPPPYTSTFCRRCGSPVPVEAGPGETHVEIPAGLLDDEIDMTTTRHIFVEHKPRWDTLTDDKPGFTAGEIGAFRANNHWLG